MPKEYRDMVEHGPLGKKVTVSQVGTFKENIGGTSHVCGMRNDPVYSFSLYCIP